MISGNVVAVERSTNFVNAIKRATLSNVEAHELDLMNNDLPAGPFDFVWCRWVLCFVSDPELLVKKIAAVTHHGGRAIFHEYGHYTTTSSSGNDQGNYVTVWHRQSNGDWKIVADSNNSSMPMAAMH